MEITLGQRIARWRAIASLRPTDLARRVGVKPSTVWEWENGDCNPSYDSLEKIARACGVELRTFFGTVPDVPDKAAG